MPLTIGYLWPAGQVRLLSVTSENAILSLGQTQGSGPELSVSRVINSTVYWNDFV
jgi:hypothetical protein